MKTITGTWWLIPALLLLGAEGKVPMEELSTIQNKAVRLVMEKFHKKDNLMNAFKLSSVLKATEIEYSAGIFVNVELTLKQTACEKTQWNETTCKHLNNGRIFNCFSCFKFEYGSHTILSELNDCVQLRFLDASRAKRRNASCHEVEMKNAGKNLLGTFSFVHSPKQ